MIRKGAKSGFGITCPDPPTADIGSSPDQGGGGCEEGGTGAGQQASGQWCGGGQSNMQQPGFFSSV